jgi:hypothetical protein
MNNRFEALPLGGKWRLLVEAAKAGALAQGYKLTRVPGRGLSNVWNVEKDGKTKVAAIRTTRDRWIAFPPLENGTKWKTLDDVELVVVAAVDSKDDPKNVEVYIFPATEVRQRFDKALAARTKAGHVNKDNFGMWVALDPDPRNIAASVGGGIAKQYKPVKVYSIETLMAHLPEPTPDDNNATDMEPEEVESAPRLTTIAEVVAWARERVAEIAGIKVEAVKLDLKMEY